MIYTRYVAVFLTLAILAGCSTYSRNVVEDTLVLRASWEEPARQAGRLDDMREHVAVFDRAVKSGDPVKVRAALLYLKPVYEEVRAEIQVPTPEQVEFDQRAQRLWDNINAPPERDWLEVALRLRTLLLVVL